MKTTELAAIVGLDVSYNRRSGRYASRDGQRTKVIAVNASAGVYRRAVSYARLTADRLHDEAGNVLTGEARDKALAEARHEGRAQFLTALGVEDTDEYVVRVEDDHDKCVALLLLDSDGTPVTLSHGPETGKKVILLVRPNWVRCPWSAIEDRRAESARIHAEREAELARQAELGRRRGELALPEWEPIIDALRDAGAGTLADSIEEDVTRNGKPSWSGWMLDIDVIVRLTGHDLPEVPEVSGAAVAA